MNNTGKIIVKNISFLMASQIMTWVLTFVLMIFLARYLGATAMGQLAVTDSIWIIAGIFVSFGMDIMLIKESSRHPEKIPELVGTALFIRLVFFVLAAGVIAIYLKLFAYPLQTIYIVYMVGISQLFLILAAIFQSSLEGLQLMQYTSFTSVLTKILGTVLGISVLLLGFGIYAIIITGIIVSFASLILQVIFLYRQHTFSLKVRLNQIVPILQASMPYLLTVLGAIFYLQIDVLMLSILIDEQMVGWYSAAIRLIGTFLFFPTVFMTAVFPALSNLYANTSDALPRLMRKSFDLMFLLSVPIGLGIVVMAQPVVNLLLGNEFAPSGPILAVLGIMLIFTYMNVLVGRFLIATDRQNTWTVIMLIAVALTVPLDLFLIPLFHTLIGNGGIGGALSFVITEFAMIIAGIFLLPKGSLGWSNVRSVLYTIIAGLAMVSITWWLRHMFIALPIIAGAITYISVVAILRIVPKEDLLVIIGVIQPLLKRLPLRKTESIDASEA